jgi:peptidylprolyl isomerase
MAPDVPAADGSSPKTQTFSGPPPMIIDPAKQYRADVVTSKGTLTIVLDAVGAPKTVNNFVFLARWHYYDGIVFHRIIPGFMLQGGDPEGSGRGGPGYRFEDELPAPGRYEIGSLAMANAGPNTNGSQFFIVSGPDGASLPPSYSLFGKVIDGLDVVKAIESVTITETD